MSEPGQISNFGQLADMTEQTAAGSLAPVVMLRLVVRSETIGVKGQVETLDGIVLREWFSSNKDWLMHDLFARPSAREFWSQVAPNGYQIVETSET